MPYALIGCRLRQSLAKPCTRINGAPRTESGYCRDESIRRVSGTAS